MAGKKKRTPKKLPSKRVMKSKGAAKKTSASKSSRSSTPRTGNAEVRRIIDLLNWTHEFTGKLLAGFSTDTLTAQVGPTDNHALWQIGHLASAYSWFASMLDGKPSTLGETFDKTFGWGSKPTPDAGAYPDHAMVRKVHDDQFQRLIRAAERLSDADAHEPTAINSNGFAKDKLDALHKCLWHEGWHHGQLSALRRALGMPGVM